MFQKEKRLKVVGGKPEVVQGLLPLCRLQRTELERSLRIARDREIDPGVAPVADSVEDDEPFMLGPLMPSWIKLADHSSTISEERN